jgi:hypothetical protein
MAADLQDMLPFLTAEPWCPLLQQLLAEYGMLYLCVSVCTGQ